MTMQNNIDIVWRNFRRNMDQPELQPGAFKIDNERPIRVPIAIAAHHRERRTDLFEVAGNCRLANISQVPDLIRLARKLDNLWRQFVMRVREHKNSKHQYLRKAGTPETKALTNSCLPVFLRDNWPASCEVSL